MFTKSISKLGALAWTPIFLAFHALLVLLWARGDYLNVGLMVYLFGIFVAFLRDNKWRYRVKYFNEPTITVWKAGPAVLPTFLPFTVMDVRYPWDLERESPTVQPLFMANSSMHHHKDDRIVRLEGRRNLSKIEWYLTLFSRGNPEHKFERLALLFIIPGLIIMGVSTLMHSLKGSTSRVSSTASYASTQSTPLQGETQQLNSPYAVQAPEPPTGQQQNAYTFPVPFETTTAPAASQPPVLQQQVAPPAPVQPQSYFASVQYVEQGFTAAPPTPEDFQIANGYSYTDHDGRRYVRLSITETNHVLTTGECAVIPAGFDFTFKSDVRPKYVANMYGSLSYTFKDPQTGAIGLSNGGSWESFISNWNSMSQQAPPRASSLATYANNNQLGGMICF
jgi:hypothetical protein